MGEREEPKHGAIESYQETNKNTLVPAGSNEQSFLLLVIM